MTPNQALEYALIICVAGSALTAIASRWRTLTGWLAFAAVSISSALVVYCAVTVLVKGPAPSFVLMTLTRLGSCRMAVDGLSAVFLLLIAGLSLVASLYSVRYMGHYPEYGLARYYPYFLLFVAGMYGIVAVTDLMVYFCAFWQLMTLPSYALVRYEYKKPQNVRAANRYLLMMEISCALVMFGAWTLGSRLVGIHGWERFDFDVLAQGMPGLLSGEAQAVTLALAAFLLGFGIKAGMWPFGQLWLPAAHPAAPSPVSALLSGVMIKTGVYGLLRSFLWLVPASALSSYPAGTWGLVIAVLGTATLFFGTIQALKQEESKRLLAFHSIGQVGYILLGLGACLALLPASQGNSAILTLAAMGLAGALFHTINHGVFKGLLFLNAGSILYATGAQSLNRMGGLAKYMPATAVTALVASFSIAGVPLFNGFASKWTIYVSTVLGSESVRYLAVLALFAILTSAITLASFIKFFGSSFLSRSSQLVKERVAEQGRLEVKATMMIPQLFLAAICVAFGLFPRFVIGFLDLALSRSAEGLGATLSKGLQTYTRTGLGVPGGQALFVPLILAATLAGMLLVARSISRLGGGQKKASTPWLCGYALESEANRYTAHGLYGEVKRYLGWAGGTARRAR